MIISHKYKFIFIKTKKTAGTSIEAQFAPHCGSTDILTPIRPRVKGHSSQNHEGRWLPYSELVTASIHPRGSRRRMLEDWKAKRKYFNHIPATRIRARVGKKVWDSYFKFCVERHPYEKTISHYYMLRRSRGENYSLDDYFDDDSFCVNLPMYSDISGVPIVDRVLQYQNLNTELAQVYEKLGVPFADGLTVRAKAHMRRKPRREDETLSVAQREHLQEVFACEFELHGYAP